MPDEYTVPGSAKAQGIITCAVGRDGAREKKVETGTWPVKLEEMRCLLSACDRKVVVYKKTILDATKQAIFLSNWSLFMLSITYRIVKRSKGE
jgi:hypothetical protein